MGRYGRALGLVHVREGSLAEEREGANVLKSGFSTHVVQERIMLKWFKR